MRSRVGAACRECVSSTGVDGGGVALVSPRGEREVVWTTDSTAASLERSQMALGEGPYVDVASFLHPLLVDDIEEIAIGVADTWPLFAHEASRLGVRGMFAFPIRVGTVSVGSLGLYRRVPGALAGGQIGAALVSVREMGRTLSGLAHGDGSHGLDGGAPHEDGDQPDPATAAGHPTTAGSSSAHVNQAAGMVMVQLDLTIQEALATLRAAAFAEGVGLVDLARDVIARRRSFGEGAHA
jgi:hypothetical protein